MKKYQELYLLAKEVYQEDLRRLDLVTHKSIRFLTILSFLIGLATYFGKWMLTTMLPPQGLIEWIFLFVAVLLFLTLIAAWLANFHVLRIEKVFSIPLDERTRTFFLKNREIDIYYAMSKTIERAYSKNRAIRNIKARYVSLGHKLILCSLGFFVIISILGVTLIWSNGRTEERRSTMINIEEREKSDSSDEEGNNTGESTSPSDDNARDEINNEPGSPEPSSEPEEDTPDVSVEPLEPEKVVYGEEIIDDSVITKQEESDSNESSNDDDDK
jgi:hypothetical protein